jgi:pimeloyl-[acyl-carrier protein] methyl ester esterase
MRSGARTRIASSSAGSPAITRSTTISATKKSTPEPQVFEVPVPGGTLAVESAGAGQALVLLHGWALDRRVWAPQRPLADRFRLIALDRRGFGRSTAPPDLAAEADDLLAVREALGLGPLILVGMSQGARAALQFALRYPEHVAGLVLQGAPLDGFEPGPRGEDSIPLGVYRALVRGGRLAEMKALWADHALMRGADVGDILDLYDGRDLLAREQAPAPLAGALGDIEAPVLVVTGEEDVPWRQLVGDALAYGLRNARRARIGGGHLCNHSRPDAYNDLVASFAAELAA